jgi:NADPH:quinone reductase-like Zn-dependent oxidoreductase
MLLIGGAGVVGSAATVIAQERGARVVRTILRSSDVDSLAPLLQEGVFMDLGKNGDMIAQTAAITNGQGFDFIINMVGGKTFEPSLKSLKEFGEMACIASPGQPRVEFSLLDFYRKNLSLYGLNTVLDGVVDSAERLKRLFAEFENKIEKLACLGQTEVMPFLEAKSVLEKALAKELRKPVFRIEEQ